MMSLLLLAGTYVAAATVGLLVTAVTRCIAVRAGIVDEPEPRRIHTVPVPRLGGMAIAGGLIVGSLSLGLVFNNVLGVPGAKSAILGLLLGGGMVFLTGLVDDVRGLRAGTKLLLQLLAAILACSLGVRVESLQINGAISLDLGWLSGPLTVLWLVGLTNAMNMIDGVDGLAGSLGAIACAVIAAFAAWTGQFTVALLMCGLLGGLTGFLALNFPPARIFMGDCGANLLGFVIASAAVVCANGAQDALGIALPALALGIPIWDTISSALRRLSRRQSVFSPDLEHIHHRFLAAGLSHRQTTAAIAAATLLASGIGLLALQVRGLARLQVLACAIVVLLLVLRRAVPVSVTDAMAKLRRRWEAIRARTEAQATFGRSILHFRNVRAFHDWWGGICSAAANMGFASLSLHVAGRSDSPPDLNWRRGGPSEGRKTIRLALPVHWARDDTALHIIAEAPTDGTLESAARRAALFGRLVDEFSPDNMPAQLSA